MKGSCKLRYRSSYSSLSMDRSCSLNSGVFSCPCTATACCTAASSTSSSVPDNFRVHPFSLGYSLQSTDLRLCGDGVADMTFSFPSLQNGSEATVRQRSNAYSSVFASDIERLLPCVPSLPPVLYFIPFDRPRTDSRLTEHTSHLPIVQVLPSAARPLN